MAIGIVGFGADKFVWSARAQCDVVEVEKPFFDEGFESEPDILCIVELMDLRGRVHHEGSKFLESLRRF